MLPLSTSYLNRPIVLQQVCSPAATGLIPGNPGSPSCPCCGRPCSPQQRPQSVMTSPALQTTAHRCRRGHNEDVKQCTNSSVFIRLFLSVFFSFVFCHRSDVFMLCHIYFTMGLVANLCIKDSSKHVFNRSTSGCGHPSNLEKLLRGKHTNDFRLSNVASLWLHAV